MNFIKVFIYYLKKKYGYYAQELGDSELQKVQQGVQNKHTNEKVFEVQYEANKYIFPSYEAFEKACKAFIEEEKSKETNIPNKRRKKNVGSVRSHAKIRTKKLPR